MHDVGAPDPRLSRLRTTVDDLHRETEQRLDALGPLALYELSASLRAAAERRGRSADIASGLLRLAARAEREADRRLG